MPLFDTTCDIYRYTAVPPAPPALAAVPCRLSPRGTSSVPLAVDYTHILTVPATTDVRDDFYPGEVTHGLSSDQVYVPAGSTAVPFHAALVRRVGRGTPLDRKEVLLVRGAATWPSDEV